MAQQPSSNRWLAAPPRDTIKVNIDANLGAEGWVGLGIVVQDATSSVFFSAVRTRAYWPPEVAECKAVHFARGDPTWVQCRGNHGPGCALAKNSGPFRAKVADRATPKNPRQSLLFGAGLAGFSGYFHAGSKFSLFFLI